MAINSNGAGMRPFGELGARLSPQLPVITVARRIHKS
jgi:hypothetical protein